MKETENANKEATETKEEVKKIKQAKLQKRLLIFSTIFVVVSVALTTGFLLSKKTMEISVNGQTETRQYARISFNDDAMTTRVGDIIKKEANTFKSSTFEPFVKENGLNSKNVKLSYISTVNKKEIKEINSILNMETNSIEIFFYAVITEPDTKNVQVFSFSEDKFLEEPEKGETILKMDKNIKNMKKLAEFNKKQ